MKVQVKIIAMAVLALLMMAGGTCALAKTEPNSKTLEESSTYDYGTLRMTIERWCYAFERTELRFFVAHVDVDEPTQLITAFAGEKYSADAVEPPTDIALRHDAILAINGDYYNYKDKVGMIIRNGVLYRDAANKRDLLLIYADGRFEGVRAGEYDPGQGQAYIDAGVEQSFAFGPVLVDEYESVDLPESYVIYTKDTVREPRTAIGQVDENHYVIIVADGRRDGWSDLGMTLQEMQEVFTEQGCRVAYNLDGGGSSTIVLEGARVNKGSTTRERSVSDIVYFTK